MSVYRTEPGVAPVRIHPYQKRRPSSASDARLTARTHDTETAKTPELLTFDLSYTDFLMLSDEQASASA